VLQVKKENNFYIILNSVFSAQKTTEKRFFKLYKNQNLLNQLLSL